MAKPKVKSGLPSAIQAHTKYKDRAFIKIFSNAARQRELFGALARAKIDPNAKVVLKTLSNVFFMGWLNDIAFTINDVIVVLIEQQSTDCINMATRIFVYLALIYQRMITAAILLPKRFMLPEPRFCVLYNGKEPLGYDSVRLSDSFIKSDLPRWPKCWMDMEVPIYDLHDPKNAGMIAGSEYLSGYVKLVETYRAHVEAGEDKDIAMKRTIEELIAQNILVDFLKEQGMEVLTLLSAEFDLADTLELWKGTFRQEGIEIGEKIGEKRGEKRGVKIGEKKRDRERALEMIRDGLPDDMIEKYTGFTRTDFPHQ